MFNRFVSEFVQRWHKTSPFYFVISYPLKRIVQVETTGLCRLRQDENWRLKWHWIDLYRLCMYVQVTVFKHNQKIERKEQSLLSLLCQLRLRFTGSLTFQTAANTVYTSSTSCVSLSLIFFETWDITKIARHNDRKIKELNWTKRTHTLYHSNLKKYPTSML